LSAAQFVFVVIVDDGLLGAAAAGASADGHAERWRL
jgi:hypothetical protein